MSSTLHGSSHWRSRSAHRWRRRSVAGPWSIPGAVLAEAPVMGSTWLPGQLAAARVRGLTCLGVALDAGNGWRADVRASQGHHGLKVDRRTNTDVRAAFALPRPPTATGRRSISVPPASGRRVHRPQSQAAQ